VARVRLCLRDACQIPQDGGITVEERRAGHGWARATEHGNQVGILRQRVYCADNEFPVDAISLGAVVGREDGSTFELRWVDGFVRRIHSAVVGNTTYWRVGAQGKEKL